MNPTNNPTEELRDKIRAIVREPQILSVNTPEGGIEHREYSPMTNALESLFHQEATKSRLDELARSYTHMDELGKHEYYDERFNTLKATLDKTGGDDE